MMGGLAGLFMASNKFIGVGALVAGTAAEVAKTWWERKQKGRQK
jgi:hypothetical protein